MSYLKKLLSIILKFTTGLGFYGVGLVVIALVLYTYFTGEFYNYIASGLIGAFVMKNLVSLKMYFNLGVDKIKEAIDK